MRVVDGLWMRPSYPGDGSEVAALGGGAAAWELESARLFRAPSAGLALWVAENAEGQIVGVVRVDASLRMTHLGLQDARLETCAFAQMARAGCADPRAQNSVRTESERFAREFATVTDLPAERWLLDLTGGRDLRNKAGDWSIGRYNEKRRGMYATPLFAGERDVHLGLDIGGPVGAPLRAFTDGEILDFAYNAAAGDYGYVLTTRHEIGGRELFALYGHLQARSIEGKKAGARFRKGDTLAWIGDVHENGGWDHPHLHLQLSWERPATCDMPGTATDADLPRALRAYPDPWLVTGPLY